MHAMTRPLLTLLALFLHMLISAQFNWQWARQYTGLNQPSAAGLAVDAAGNTVVCGGFFGTLNIGALPAITSNGGPGAAAPATTPCSTAARWPSLSVSR